MSDSKVPPGQMPLLDIDQESLLDEARRELHTLFPQRLQSLMGRSGVGMRAMAAITGISRSHLLRLKKVNAFQPSRRCWRWPVFLKWSRAIFLIHNQGMQILIAGFSRNDDLSK